MREKKDIFFVTEEGSKKRLDIFLSERLGVSRSKVHQYIQDGRVMVNGKPPKKAGETVKEGDEVMVRWNSELWSEEKSDAVKDVRIIAEARDYIVVHKPAGLLTHPTAAREEITLFSWLAEIYPEVATIGDSKTRGGIVHRLDRDASGLLVAARTQKMFDALKRQFQARTIEKEYIVLVHGKVPKEHGMLDFAIGRGKEGRMAARPKSDRLTIRGLAHEQEGKEAITEFRVEKRMVRYTLLSVCLHTGRMHQIRVHMLAYNHPVVGDMVYCNTKLNRTVDLKLGRLFLHAARLCFDDPNGERVCFEDPLPEELAEALKELR